MSTNLYLKKQLATNIPKIVTLKKRAGSYPETDFKTKQPTGKYEHLYIFTDDTGQEMKHYAKEREEETLALFNAGEKLQVVLQETMKNIDGVDKRISFLTWTPPDGAEAAAAATPQLKSNTSVTRQDRDTDQSKLDEDRKWRRIDLSKIVFGYMNTALAQGKNPTEAAALAFSCYKLQEETVNELFEQHYQNAA